MTSSTRVTSVRGLDRDLYMRMVSIAKSLGKTTGELINEAIRLYLALIEGPGITIRKAVGILSSLSQAFKEGLKETELIWIKNIDEIELTRQEIERLGKKVLISNVKKVIFSEDVDEEVFDRFIYRIIACGEVIVPRQISRIIVYSKCQFVDKISYK